MLSSNGQSRFALVVFAATTIAFLSFGIVDANRAFAQEGATSNRVVERYWKLFLENPRYGAAFDRVYTEASSRGDVEGLAKRLETEIGERTGDSRGKALVALALVQRRRNDLESSIETLRRAREEAPNLSLAATTLAENLTLSGRLAESAAVYEESLKLGLSNDERVATLQKLGGLYSRLANAEASSRIWDRATEECGDNEEALAELADALADAREYRRSATLFERLEQQAIARRDAENGIRFAVGAGDMRLRLGEESEALADFERAASLASSGHRLFKSLRDKIEYVFLLRSDYEGLAERYQSIVARSPGDLDAVSRLVVSLGALGRYDDAEETLRNAIKRAPKESSLVRSAIELEIARDRYDAADEYYRRLDELNATSTDDMLAWGDVVVKNDALSLTEKRRRAVEIWERAKEISPDSTAIALVVAEKLQENLYDEEAERALAELARSRGTDVEVVKALANFYFARNRDADADGAFESYVATAPTDPSVYSERGEFYRSIGRLDRALSDAKKAVELAPDSFKYRFALGEEELATRAYDSLNETLDKLDALASTSEEETRAFDLRLRALKATNGARDYLDALSKTLDEPDVELTELSNRYRRLIVALLYFDDPNGATDAALDALARGAANDAIVAKIPEITAKSRNPRRALELARAATPTSGARRSDCLRSIARLQLELGDADGARDTAFELASEARDDASSRRDAADIVLRCGRLDDAISLLREGLLTSPNDRATALKLAGLLDESGSTYEAAQIATDVFEKSTRLEEKLSLVETLTTLYAKLDKFDELRARLRSVGASSETRRENARCLARAYMTLRDYDSARTTLETAVATSDSRARDDEFILGALSKLAELQNDLRGAIRYQERVCATDDSRIESDRLLTLYRRAGEKEKARSFFKTKILPRDPLWKQLETVDVLFSVEDYEAASETLDELAAKYRDQWEIAARRALVAFWTRDPRFEERAREFEGLQVARETKSTKVVALERDSTIATTTIAGDAWKLGDVAGVPIATLSSPDDYRALAAQTLTTVYRDRLTLVDKARRSTSATLAKPQLPTPQPVTFGAAEFCVAAARTRISDDAESLLDRFPVDVESNDLNSQKLAFAALEYGALLRANLSDESNADRDAERAEKLEALARRIARDDDAWRVEVFPNALRELLVAEDEETIRQLSAFLVESMERSLSGGFTTRDGAIWRRAAAVANALATKGSTELAERARALVEAAGARDYRTFLSNDSDGGYVDYETFRNAISAAEGQLSRQAVGRDAASRAREAFGAAFAARLRAERDLVYASTDSRERERAEKNCEIWTTLSDKISFGRVTLTSFINLNRRDLFESAGVDSDARARFDELESRVYEIARDACAFDARTNSTLARDEEVSEGSGSNIATPDALGYLSREDRVAFNLAEYLIYKTRYGADRSSTALESGRVLELAQGVLFAIDVAEKPEPDFARIDRFGDFLTELADREKDSPTSRYARRALETQTRVKAFARGEVASEDVATLRSAALDNLVRARKSASSDEVPTLVALALLAKYEGDARGALARLEEAPLVALTDVKARELAVLEAFPGNDDATIAARKSRAISSLLGWRLDESEATRFLAVLEREERTEEATTTRKRLEAFARDPKTLLGLLDAALARLEAGRTLDDDDVVFALKVFRTPSWTIADRDAASELRAKALVALDESGRLTQTRDDLIRLVSAAPGSTELTLRLADARARLGELEDAKRLLDSLEGKAFSDAALLLDYAESLSRAGETSKAKSALASAYVKKPEAYFADDVKPEYWTLEDDLSYLEGETSETLAPFARSVFLTTLEARRESSTRERAKRFLDKFWRCEDASSDVRRAIQIAGARVFAQGDDPTLAKYLVERVLADVAPNDDENEPYADFNDPHAIIRWDAERPETISTKTMEFISPTEDAETLESFGAGLDEYLERFARQRDPNVARFSSALVARLQVLARQGRVDELKTRLEEAEKIDFFCAKGLKNDALALALACDQFVDDDRRSALTDVLVKYYERAREENPHPAYERFYTLKLCSLGLKSANEATREKYREASAKKLQETFRLAANADLTSPRRVGGTTETTETLTQYAEGLWNALVDSGAETLAREAFARSNVESRTRDAPQEAVEEWREYFATLRRLVDGEEQE